MKGNVIAGGNARRSSLIWLARHRIIAHDNPGMEAKREELREAHRNYLAGQGKRLLASGAFLSEDGQNIKGGASLLDTEDFNEAIQFEAQDPYAKAGIRAQVEIGQCLSLKFIAPDKSHFSYPPHPF